MVALHDPAKLDEALELLFFGFRSVTREPDRILARYKLNRLHHRVLFFVARRPGMSVGTLLGILGISKQALHRPLSELARLELLLAAPCATDRRSKELWLTPKGAKLETRLSTTQRTRFQAAFASVGPVAEQGWRDVMRSLAEEAAPSAVTGPSNRRR
jgi:DNA-binding MarR family transcriptional regulator